MKCYRLIVILVASLVFSCDNDDYPHSEVPSVILNEFWTQFPDASDVEFKRMGENYEVEFELNGIDAGAFIAPSGNLIKEKKEILLEEFPAEVQNVLKKYGRKKIDNTERVITDQGIYYQAQVKRFWLDTKLVLDETGKEDPTFIYWE